MSDFPTDMETCLCCGGDVGRRYFVPRATPEKWASSLGLFLAMGYTREELLTKHRAQLDYQLPGMSDWMIEADAP